MSQPEINHKLMKFLADHVPPSEECHIVYLLVEIRKILDHEESAGTFPLLKF